MKILNDVDGVVFFKTAPGVAKATEIVFFFNKNETGVS